MHQELILLFKMMALRGFMRALRTPRLDLFTELRQWIYLKTDYGIDEGVFIVSESVALPELQN